MERKTASARCRARLYIRQKGYCGEDVHFVFSDRPFRGMVTQHLRARLRANTALRRRFYPWMPQ